MVFGTLNQTREWPQVDPSTIHRSFVSLSSTSTPSLNRSCRCLYLMSTGTGDRIGAWMSMPEQLCPPFSHVPVQIPRAMHSPYLCGPIFCPVRDWRGHCAILLVCCDLSLSDNFSSKNTLTSTACGWIRVRGKPERQFSGMINNSL